MQDTLRGDGSWDGAEHLGQHKGKGMVSFGKLSLEGTPAPMDCHRALVSQGQSLVPLHWVKSVQTPPMASHHP